MGIAISKVVGSLHALHSGSQASHQAVCILAGCLWEGHMWLSAPRSAGEEDPCKLESGDWTRMERPQNLQSFQISHRVEREVKERRFF